MRTKSKSISGAEARKVGLQFQQIVESVCAVSKIGCIVIPDGCKPTKIRGRLVNLRVKSPFDMIFCFKGKTALIDCKSFVGDSLSYSDINDNQKKQLSVSHKHGGIAGYLVNFRAQRAVVFFDSGKLTALKPRQALRLEDGILIGKDGSWNLQRIFEVPCSI